jgi:hypothetical protein
MRRAARIDANQPDIVEAFRSRGVSVAILSALGNGVLDLLISLRGFTMLVEVKMPDGKLTPDQKRFMAGWQGAVSIVRDEEGVETVCKFMRSMADKLGGV